jgi:hypothetical protein
MEADPAGRPSGPDSMRREDCAMTKLAPGDTRGVPS